MYKSGKICSLQSRILVIGGGPAGICAAIAAAREGADTILINNRPVLGGNSSSEVRVWTRGATGGGSLFAEEMGIWGELKLRNLYANPEGNPVFWDETLLDGIYREKGIRLLENTQMVGVEMDEDRVTAIEAVQLGTEKHFRIQAEVYVDATGDGSLGQLAGIPFIQGREAASEYGEKLAPEVREKETLGNTLFFFTGRSEEPVRYVAPEYALSIEEVETLLGKGGRLVNEEMNGCDYWWFELGGREDTIGDNQEITRRLRSLSAGVWNYIKNSGKFQADHLTLRVISYVVFTLPVGTWTLKSYFDQLPDSLIESAKIDGAGHMKILWRIVFPVTIPGMISIAIYGFVWSWNDLLYSMTLVTDSARKTLAPGLVMTFLGEGSTNWGMMMAASIVAAIPVTIIFVFLQRYFIQGLTAGAVKG